MSIKRKVAVALGGLGGRVSRGFGLGGGTSLPGAIALRLDPGLIGALAGRLDRGPILITATNGKTTTANMLASICREAALEPVHNAAGANLTYGIATALMAAYNTKPGSDSEPRIGIFEVDEATVRNVSAQLAPRVFSVGNLFRDQLDRFGEVDQTARLIQEGIEPLAPDATLVLNADDPRVAALGRDSARPVLYFGLGEDVPSATTVDDAQDSKDCLICGEPLAYTKRYFSHLGEYACPHCGFRRPLPEVTAVKLRLSLKETRFLLCTPGGDAEVALPAPALFNVYNALAAASAALAAGISLDSIVAGLNAFSPAFGRFETLEAAGRRLRLMLVKNPTGFDQAIGALEIEPGPKNLVIAINDNLADGTDVSWLWDANLERLGQTGAVVTTGTRAHDMALRLKYAGIAETSVIVDPDLAAALERAFQKAPPGEEIFVLSTYTAMLDIRKHLEKTAGVAAFWADRGSDAPREEVSP